MTADKKREFTLRITSANKSELIVILYEMTIEYLMDMEEAIGRRDFKETARAAGSARNCISELCSSLNAEFEIALNLFGIYEFCEKQISRAQGRMNAPMVVSVRKMFTQLKEAWEKVAAQDTSAPLMENTQEIYSGLTYGKDAVSSNGEMVNTQRGFYA